MLQVKKEKKTRKLNKKKKTITKATQKMNELQRANNLNYYFLWLLNY